MKNKFFPKFWKMSHGQDMFGFNEIIEYISQNIVMIHKDTGAMASSNTTQAEYFVKASIGDYFYLTNGNKGIYLLGQFSGPANFFGQHEGWIERPYRLIKTANKRDIYHGITKWWTPDFNSTFVQIPQDEMDLFEEYILQPYFDLDLKKYCE